MDFIASDAPSRLASGTCPLGLSAVIALGGGRSSAINAAARAMVNAGVFVAVAAGASNDDSTFYSPAGEPSVCTAGATDQTDMKAWFSNYGEGLDLFAPGVDVTTTVLDGGVVSSFFSFFVSLFLSCSLLQNIELLGCARGWRDMMANAVN